MWLCTRHSCGAVVADLAVLEMHAKTHTTTRKRKLGLKLKQTSETLPNKKPNVECRPPLPAPEGKQRGNSNQPRCTLANACEVVTDNEQHLGSHSVTKEPFHETSAEVACTRAEKSQERTEPDHMPVCSSDGHRFRSLVETNAIDCNRTIRSDVNGTPTGCRVQHPAANTTSNGCHFCPWIGCEFSTADQKNMKAHTRSHTGEKRFHCKMVGCPFKSSRSGDLREHTRIHTGEKPFACTWEGCSYATAQTSNLKRHILVHTGKKPFACTWGSCGYRATTASNLKQHVRTHTHERPFGCSWDGCEYRAARGSELKKHLRKHKEGVHAKVKNQSA
jgi:hypothetical protein